MTGRIVAYELVNEDLTELGGPMGSERTSERYRKHFSSVSKAMAAAEKEYESRIDWVADEKGYRSPDLGHTMYHINPIKVEG